MKFGADKLNKERLLRIARSGGKVVRAAHGIYNIYDGARKISVDKEEFQQAFRQAYGADPNVMQEMCDPDVLTDMGEAVYGIAEVAMSCLQQ